MNKLPIDIGSGITKWLDPDGKIARISTVAGQLTGSDNDTFGVEKMPKVEFEDMAWLVGGNAEAVFPPDRRVNSLTPEWAGSEGWMALFYYCIAKSFPKGGKIDLIVATGLPQALYATSRGNLENKLNRVHEFKVKGIEYAVNVDTIMVPQALAALMYQSTHNADILSGTAATIDVGTYTTGWTVLRNGQMQNWRSDGAEVGVSNLGNAVKAHLKSEFGINIDPATIPTILMERKVSYRNKNVDLSDVLPQLMMQVVKPVEDQIRMSWEGGAGDIPHVFINGGGGEFFLPAFQRIIPHAVMGVNPSESVVRGLGEFLG